MSPWGLPLGMIAAYEQRQPSHAGRGILRRINTFVNIDGDEGSVTGAFLRKAHEAVGGTLKREDLSASFAGQR